MDKTIELLKQAEARIRVMISDFENIAHKAQEISTLLTKHINEPTLKGPDLSLLSDREKEIFLLLGQGLTGRKIAARLGIAIKTFAATRDNIRKKLKIPNAYELTRIAQATVKTMK